VARGFKRRLGDPTPLVLGGAAYSPAALMAAQLKDVLTRISRAEGGPPATVVLTCPAMWGPYRREHFAEVPRLAGVPVSRLITEPEAAATHYSVERRLGDGEVVAVYDLGGGTFDTTILRMRSGGMEILGTPEGIEHLGGIDFDEALLAHVDDRLDGAVSALDRADPVAAATLAEIRAMCVRAKEELSTEPDVVLSVPLPSGRREVTVTRLELNEMIRPSVRTTTDALRRTVMSAGLSPDDLSAVLLAGGSSRVPLVRQMVTEEFGKPVHVTLHPKFTVALGAAAVSGRAAPSTPPGGMPVTVTPAIGMPQQALPMSPSGDIPVATRRRKWLVPAIAAAVVVISAAVTTVVLTSGEPTPAGQQAEPRANTATSTPTTTSTAQATSNSVAATAPATPPPTHAATTQAAPPAQTAPPTLWVYNNGPVLPFHSLIASSDNWGGLDFGAAGARQTPITAAPDDTGLRVTWNGASPGEIYLQDVANVRDFTSYVDNGGALVFDTVVHAPPADATTIGVHCKYPCASSVLATTLFRAMPTGQKTTVKIPLNCFTARGLNAERVDTPFLVYTGGAFDATFSAVRWETNVKDATPCSALT
jgi:actin-like ATPase involved in cell morphogenesis